MTNRHKVYIDFETRSQCNIWDCGAWVYSKHPTTEVLCICYAVDNSDVVCNNIPKTIEILNEYTKLGYEFHAHNAFFERSICKNVLSKQGLLHIPLKQWRCTAAKALANALPKSLENCALALDCSHKKDMSGAKVMKKLSTSTGYIDPFYMDKLISYCKTDVLVERDIDLALPDLSDKEQRIWFMDQIMNDTGVKADVAAVKIAVDCIGKETERLTLELQELTGGQIMSGSQRDAVKNWLVKRGVPLTNLTKESVAKALSTTSGVEMRVLQLRQKLSQTSNAKLNTILEALDTDDNRVKDLLSYHWATTGRWAGKLVQMHNLPRPKFDNLDTIKIIDVMKSGGYDAMSMLYDDDLLDVISSCIRSMFIPSDNHDMFITDYSAIEARVVMWLAGADNGIKGFVNQDKDPTAPDIYVTMARQIYNNQKLTKANKMERTLGKQACLGCGYGMGASKFRDTCAKYGILINEDMALKAVNGYRRFFSKVPAFWRATENAAIQAVRTKTPQQVGKILFYMDEKFLRLKLPSGRTLAYHLPKIVDERLTYMSTDSVTKRYVEESTYGGRLVEHATQATARDIMAESMFHFFSSGFKILFTVHDELVLEAPRGTKTCQDVLNIVTNIPSWAEGCPINAECEKTERYKK